MMQNRLEIQNIRRKCICQMLRWTGHSCWILPKSCQGKWGQWMRHTSVIFSTDLMDLWNQAPLEDFFYKSRPQEKALLTWMHVFYNVMFPLICFVFYNFIFTWICFGVFCLFVFAVWVSLVFWVKVSLCSSGWPGSQRSACFYLPGAGIKGEHPYACSPFIPWGTAPILPCEQHKNPYRASRLS